MCYCKTKYTNEMFVQVVMQAYIIILFDHKSFYFCFTLHNVSLAFQLANKYLAEPIYHAHYYHIRKQYSVGCFRGRGGFDPSVLPQDQMTLIGLKLYKKDFI